MISRRNGLKHGLSGQGVVVPEGDLEEIERRVEALEADMRPNSPAGEILIRRMATLSVRMEAATRQEFAARAKNIRHAADDFDEARIDEAEALFDALGEDPRRNLRKLRKSPEGVDCLIAGWQDLRADLTRDPKPCWTARHFEDAAILTGLRVDHARGTRLGALSRGVWGDFLALSDCDGGNLGEQARRIWSRARLVERIDAEIAALEAHRRTLDFETIELDRAEAGERALFDSSKAATLARRYESEAQNGFFKALKEFRTVEAVSAAHAEASPSLPASSRVGGPLGSSREEKGPVAPEHDMALLGARLAEVPVVRGPDGQPLRIARPAQSPG